MKIGTIKQWFVPNAVIGMVSTRVIILLQLSVFLVVWITSDFPFLPSPIQIGTAWWKLITDGLGYELVVSLMLTFEATALTLFFSLMFVYASVMPFFRPVVMLITKFRFNGVVGLTLFFTLLTSNSHQLKVTLLVFSMSVWFVTSLVRDIQSIPQEEYEHAKTLGMSDWRVVLEVIILGKADKVLEVLRQNTAISWLMLTTVEGLVRTDGGIGALLTVQSKYLHVSEVLAIQITILVVGITLDWSLGFLRRMLFPYADISTENR